MATNEETFEERKARLIAEFKLAPDSVVEEMSAAERVFASDPSLRRYVSETLESTRTHIGQSLELIERYLERVPADERLMFRSALHGDLETLLLAYMSAVHDRVLAIHT